eukprot:15790-Pelagomonas_calceolata.AAC.1
MNLADPRTSACVHSVCAAFLGVPELWADGTLAAAYGLSVECAVRPSVGVHLHLSVCQSFRGTAS